MPALTSVRNSLISDMMRLLSLATPHHRFLREAAANSFWITWLYNPDRGHRTQGLLRGGAEISLADSILEARSDEKTGVQNTYVDGCLDQLVRIPLNVRLAKSLRVER